MKEFLANSAADHGVALNLEPVSFSDAVTRAAQDYQEAARRKNLEIRLELSAEPANVLADRNALMQVLDNLLSNALKFSPANKQITIIVRPAEAGVECLIQDQVRIQCRRQGAPVSALCPSFRPAYRGRTFNRTRPQHCQKTRAGHERRVDLYEHAR